MPHQQSRAKEMEKFYQTEMSEEAEGFPEKWREGRVVVDVGEVRINFFGSSHLKMNQPFLELARWFQAFLVSFYPDFLGEMMQFDWFNIFIVGPKPPSSITSWVFVKTWKRAMFTGIWGWVGHEFWDAGLILLMTEIHPPVGGGFQQSTVGVYNYNYNYNYNQHPPQGFTSGPIG